MIALGWLLFFAFWAKVLWQDPNGAVPAGILIAAALLIVPAITTWWVLHNKGIYRRKGPRGPGFSPPEVYDIDWRGRRVIAQWPQLKEAAHITVTPSEHAKVYQGTKRDAT